MEAVAASRPWVLLPCSSGSREFDTILVFATQTLTWSQMQLYGCTLALKKKKNAELSIIANAFKVLTSKSPYSANLLCIASGKVQFKMSLAAGVMSVLPFVELKKWRWQQEVSKENKEYICSARNNLNF